MKSIIRMILWWAEENSTHIIVGLLIVMLLLAIFVPRVFVVIHSGEKGVIYKPFEGGTVTGPDEIYGEGMHLIFPWNEVYVYNVRQQTNEYAFEVLTKDNLPIRVSIAVRYYPGHHTLGYLHKEFGRNYERTVIKPEIISATRSVFAAREFGELHIRSGNAVEDQVYHMARETLHRAYIEVEDVMIKQIKLPTEVKNAAKSGWVQQRKQKTVDCD